MTSSSASHCKQRRYASFKTRLVLQRYLQINVDLSNPISTGSSHLSVSLVPRAGVAVPALYNLTKLNFSSHHGRLVVSKCIQWNSGDNCKSKGQGTRLHPLSWSDVMVPGYAESVGRVHDEIETSHNEIEISDGKFNFLCLIQLSLYWQTLVTVTKSSIYNNM